LLNTILDIIYSKGIDRWLAVNKFFNDIEIQYDAKLGFETKKERLSFEFQALNKEREKILTI
jgi:hypothetical protein